jgi:Trypsin
MLPRRLGSLLIALAITAAVAHPAAIVMRHDREDSRYVELAKRFPMSVTIRRATGQRFGDEATLIRPTWVLTAAHVTTRLGPGDLVEAGATTRRMARVVRHPEWQGEASVRADIALIEFDEPFPGITPALLYKATDEAGLVVTFVGRGGYGTGLTGPKAEDRVPRAATNRVDAVDGTLLRFRFDAPDDPGVTDLEGVSGPGDSGGAAYLVRDDVTYVVGVSSSQDARPTGRQPGRYGVIELYPRVSSFVSWIESVVGAG